MLVYFILELMTSDISESRLAIGKKLGADQIVVVDSRDPRAVAAKVVEAMGCEPDITIECSGAESSIQTAIYVGTSIYFQVYSKIR